jgi:predicted nucleic acid-binding protein
MAVLDASPIIYYSRIGRLAWLKGFYGVINTTPSVIREIVDDAREVKKPGVSAIENSITRGEIGIIKLPGEEKEEARKISILEGIEREDAELLVVARKEREILVTNDKILRTIARMEGVRVHWAVTPVLKSSKDGKSSIGEAKTIIKELVKAGLRLKPETLVTIYEVLEGLED